MDNWAVDANEWTGGKALLTTGSPFPPIKTADGKLKVIGQSNNALVYPGFGLGYVILGCVLRLYSRLTRSVIISKATKLTDPMITAGVTALAQLAPALEDPDKSLLPSLEHLRVVSVKVATAVANAARAEGVAKVQRDSDWTEAEVRESQWDPGLSSYLFYLAFC